MKYVIALLLTTATICAATPDVKNLAVGAGSYGLARGAIAFAIEPKWEGENYWVKAVGAGFASFAWATWAGTFVESFQTGDTPAECKRDENARMYGAALSFGVDMAAHAVWYIVKSK